MPLVRPLNGHFDYSNRNKNMSENLKNLFVTLSFEKTFLPPFEDVLVIGRNNPAGMNGISQSIDFLVPDGFDRFPVEDENVVAVIINKNILLRASAATVLNILKKRVFPFVGKNEIIKVDFAMKVVYEAFPIEVE
jgi:hypothetical protein